MMRKAFVMSLYPGTEQEYERRHNPVWGELLEVLKAHGVHNYSIFLHSGTGQLFAYVEIDSEEQWSAIAKTPECQRWWRHMSSLMPHNADNSPSTQPLRELFHLD